jgi:ATP-dependent RNA helicase DDX54/DBP10
MDNQFSQLDQQPDIVIATPGRLLHLLVEMGRKLNHVKMAVFDEADQLFDMGFSEQLNEILGRLPESKQVLLFSATLPNKILEFAKVRILTSKILYFVI